MPRIQKNIFIFTKNKRETLENKPIASTRNQETLENKPTATHPPIRINQEQITIRITYESNILGLKTKVLSCSAIFALRTVTGFDLLLRTSFDLVGKCSSSHSPLGIFSETPRRTPQAY